ncbi:MAG: peptidoglycan/LPS O-acetylase OafA/YrhL [Crocinitomix sp.]|jgi:peptidoglycan/LPS O-acetylase OafA/YrhL
MDKKNDHILIINSLRGLAATAVCFYHFVFTTQDYVKDETLLSIFEYGDRGVQLFFIISGIVIPLSMINSAYTLKKWKSFILKRFIRIEPPYLVAVAIGIVYLIARNYVPGTVSIDLTPTFTEILLHLGYLIPFVENTNWVNPVFWTLAVEFQYYLALSVFFPLVLTGKLLYRSIFYAVFIGAGFATLSYAFFPHWSPYFLAGIIYILMRKEVISKIEFGIVALILTPIIYFNLGPVDLGIAIVTLLLIHYLSNFKTKLTLFLGKISYSLYLVHSMIGAAFINYLSHSYREPYQKFIVISLGFAITVGSAYILYRFVEKPSHKWAKKIGK